MLRIQNHSSRYIRTVIFTGLKITQFLFKDRVRLLYDYSVCTSVTLIIYHSLTRGQNSTAISVL